jgi:hypothetical protein
MTDFVTGGKWYVGRTAVKARAFAFLSHESKTKDVRFESGYRIIEGPYNSADKAQGIADKRNGATVDKCKLVTVINTPKRTP